jgi:integrase
MATIFKRKNKDRSISFLTIVRVKGFKPTSRCFKTKAEAVAWAEPKERELKEQSKRGGMHRDATTITIGRLIEQFLADPNTSSLKTFDDLHSRLDWWSAHPLFATTKVMEFGVVQLHAARAKLLASGKKTQGRSPATVNRHLSALRSCWNWARASGLIPLERAWPSKLLLKEPPGRAVFLSEDGLAGLLKVAEADPVVRAAILLSVATGIRRGELLKLKWADVDLGASTLTLYETKNKTTRRVYVPGSAVAALKALREGKVAALGGSVFVNASGKPLGPSHLNKRWYRVRAAAGLKDFRWHDLRHSCASFLAQNGSTLLEIGSVLGHKSSTMTKRYAHLVEGKAVKGHAALDVLLRRT